MLVRLGYAKGFVHATDMTSLTYFHVKQRRQETIKSINHKPLNLCLQPGSSDNNFELLWEKAVR